MPRLRTTAALSLLMLAGGIAGTAWLSDRTARWKAPAPRMAQPASKHSPAAQVATRRERLHTPPLRAVRGPSIADAVAAPAVSAASASLTPIDMPWPDASLFSRRADRAGRAVLQLDIDGQGRVIAARIAESSGNDALDAEALSVVKGWRFEVPQGHPDGASGQLAWRTVAP